MKMLYHVIVCCTRLFDCIRWYSAAAQNDGLAETDQCAKNASHQDQNPLILLKSRVQQLLKPRVCDFDYLLT